VVGGTSRRSPRGADGARCGVTGGAHRACSQSRREYEPLNLTRMRFSLPLLPEFAADGLYVGRGWTSSRPPFARASLEQAPASVERPAAQQCDTIGRVKFERLCLNIGGTITTRDRLASFLRFVVRPEGVLVGSVLLTVLIVGYRFGVVSTRGRTFVRRTHELAPRRRRCAGALSCAVAAWIGRDGAGLSRRGYPPGAPTCVEGALASRAPATRSGCVDSSVRRARSPRSTIPTS
jgi:hypothetical protein